MPPKKQVDKCFLRQVFEGHKKLMKKNRVSYIHVPQWDELSVKRMWTDLSTDKAFNIYFQDKYQDSKGPNREFFMNILNSIYPDYLSQVMTHASN